MTNLTRKYYEKLMALCGLQHHIPLQWHIQKQLEKEAKNNGTN